MNDEFLQGRSRAIRSIAIRADPFTKKRLLDLADRYEDSIRRPRRATRSLNSQLAADIQADQSR
jgi:hypothetical protein